MLNYQVWRTLDEKDMNKVLQVSNVSKRTEK